MQILALKQVHKQFVTRTILKCNHLLINEGERIGLVGVNGVGKSTLLRMIIGQDTDFEGQIVTKGRLTYLPQLKTQSVQSGGEQTMAAIQSALLSQPDLLLLDEPSANLDETNRQVLTQALAAYKGSMLVVSHDRQLLDEQVDQIWEMVDGRIQVYEGNYTDYQNQKAIQEQQERMRYQVYCKKVKQLEEEAQRRAVRAQAYKRKSATTNYSDYKVKARMAGDGQEKALAKSAKVLQRRIKQLTQVNQPTKERTYHFKAVGQLNQDKACLINLLPGPVKVGSYHLFDLTNFRITSGDKIAIHGPNQSGKTSFLRQLYHRHLAGYYAPELSMGYFAQNFDVIDTDKTVFANIVSESQQDIYVIKNVLGALGFPNDKLTQVAASLSGGERVRLSFAKVLLGNHQLLLLDEPSNYLDINTLNQVEQFLKDFPGAIILVSHDNRFVQQVADQHLCIKQQKLLSESYRQDYSDSSLKRLQLLEWQLTQLMIDPSITLNEIKQLKGQIEVLKEKNKYKK